MSQRYETTKEHSRSVHFNNRSVAISLFRSRAKWLERLALTDSRALAHAHAYTEAKKWCALWKLDLVFIAQKLWSFPSLIRGDSRLVLVF